jgi:uncharacterized Zn-finger protein
MKKDNYPIKVSAFEDEYKILCCRCPKCENFIPNVGLFISGNKEIECSMCKWKFRVGL